MIEFQKFKKIPRLSREIVITEKIDGTNGVIYISEDLSPITLESGRVVPFLVGSHSRWLFPENDNHGFATWAYQHAEELIKLGKGYHYGEWVGKGIQRKYGLQENRFYLFNARRWVKRIEVLDNPSIDFPPLNDKQEYCPDCCHVVPILYKGEFNMEKVTGALLLLQGRGSYAVPGFQPPEGIVIYHTAGGCYFKKTILNDDKPKGQNEQNN
jgi:hypothetical protein